MQNDQIFANFMENTVSSNEAMDYVFTFKLSEKNGSNYKMIQCSIFNNFFLLK